MNSNQQDPFYQQAAQLSAQQYEAFKRAIETGKWSNGDIVNQQQRALMLQAVIIYENANPTAGAPTGVLDDRCASRSQPPAEQRQQTIALQAGASPAGSANRTDSASDLAVSELIASEREL